MNLLKFDQFTIDPERRRLLRAGDPVPLTPKTFDTLLTLVRERGRVVEKSELMQLLWPDTAVEENNLSQQISAARKALGERSDEGRYIRTVPGRGRSAHRPPASTKLATGSRIPACIAPRASKTS